MSTGALNAIPLPHLMNAVEATIEYQSVLQVPLHQLSMCMIENNADINDIKHIFEASNNDDDDKQKTIAACVITPCEYEESSRSSVYSANTYSYICENQERAGELLSRIRRKKRSDKLVVSN
jgi:hypothetical protein